jgi:hypothetical protein
MALPPSLRWSLAAAIACSALLAPPSAYGAWIERPYTSPTLTRYLQVAERHWGVPAPTCTGEHGAPVGVIVALYNDPDPDVVAAAEQPGCRIWLDRDFWPRPASKRDCVTIVHEWGHLLGHGHANDPNSLMFTYPTGGAPGCEFVNRRVRAHARERLARKRARARRMARRCGGGRRGALGSLRNRTYPRRSWVSGVRSPAKRSCAT